MNETVLCWYYHVAELSDPALFTRGMQMLPWDGRREKVLRLRFGPDRQLCLGAGLLAAYALRQAGAEDLALGSGEHGKPYLLRHKDIFFNLSHSGSIVACAIAPSPVGVDVEKPREPESALLRRCFTEDERRWLECQSDRNHAFVRLWTRKESYLKLLGTGISVPLTSFSVCPEESCPEQYRFSETELDGHQLCVCSAEKETAAFREAKLF